MAGTVLLEDPAVRKWLANIEQGYWINQISVLRDFLRFLEERGFESHTPSGLIEFQRRAVHDGREYELLDLLQEYIIQKHGTYNTLRMRYSKLRTFFKRNRAALKDDDFEIKAKREPIRSRLTVDVIKSLVDAADLGFKAFYLTLWMGILDQARFNYFNKNYGADLARHIKERGVDQPFMMTFPGRKQWKNRIEYYTFIGRDALAAWQQYFERIRGWPKEGEPVLLNRDGKIFNKDGFAMKHLRLLERLKYIKRGGSTATRHGYNLHDFRDEAKTLLHLQGKSDGLDLDYVKFWMGHIIDPNFYDKFYRDKERALKQYRIAEKYLNILSGIQVVPQFDTKELVEQIIMNPSAFKILREALGEFVGAKLAPAEKRSRGSGIT